MIHELFIEMTTDLNIIQLSKNVAFLKGPLFLSNDSICIK